MPNLWRDDDPRWWWVLGPTLALLAWMVGYCVWVAWQDGWPIG